MDWRVWKQKKKKKKNNHLILTLKFSAVDITDFKNQKVLPLVLSQKWLSLAGASEPLVLKNVYVQNQLIPVTSQDQVRIHITTR